MDDLRISGDTNVFLGAKHLIQSLQRQDHIFVEALLDLRIFEVETRCARVQEALHASQDNLRIHIAIALSDYILIYEAHGNEVLC